MTQQKPQEKEAFVYVKSDTTKTPVDLSAQPRGTVLMFVTPNGSEYEVVAGAFHLKAAETPESLAQLAKIKSWDKKDAEFPNLKISRD